MAGAPVPALPAGTRERLAAGAWMMLGGAMTLAFLILLAPILTPFALGAVLAYVLRPGAAWLQRHGLGATGACVLMVLVCAALALGLLLILLPLLEREAISFNRQLPDMITALDSRIAPLAQQWLGLHVHFDPAALRALAMQQVGQQDALGSLLTRFGNGGLSVLGSITSMLLVPVVLFYLLRDGERFFGILEASIPRRWQALAHQMLIDVDTVLAQFLRGQLAVMLALAVYYSVALTLAGVNSALPIGVLTGLLTFIPYAGFALGLTLASLVALLESGTWPAILGVAVVYGLGQILEGFVLTPRLVGERIGLHPLAVIFALLAFGHLFGFFGILLALPASAALLVALLRLRAAYLASAFYQRT